MKLETTLSTKLRWLIRLRWITVAAAAPGGLMGFRMVFLHRDLAWPFGGTLLFLCLFNWYSLLLLKDGRRVSERAVFHQLLVDLVSIAVLLALTGGSRNPFLSLLLIPAGLGALLLRGRESTWFLLGLLAALTGLYLMRDAQVIAGEIYVTDTLPLVSTLVAAGVVWSLIASLSRTLELSHQKLDALKDHQNRMDHLRALGALTAELSHQFATPLNTIKLRAGRLSRKAPTPELEEDLAALQRAVERCETVLRTMVAAPVDPASVTFDKVEIHELVGALVGRWASAKGTHPVEILPARRDPVYCRLPHLIFAQSFLSLLDNASQAAPPSETIEVAIAGNRCQVSISVLDRGPGFPEIVKARLGEPFLTTRAAGTGLGLYNCKSFCDALNGSFAIGDRQGGGAVARMVLPAEAMA